MKIAKNKFVSVSYELNVGEGDEREMMERATNERPLNFIFGTGSMLLAFEDNLRGLQAGESFQFSLSPEDAYGEYVEEHVIEVPKKAFEIDGKFDSERVTEGATLPMYNDSGERLNGSVIEIKGDVVVMDFNHPLAGETLHFSGAVLAVRETTEEEILAFNQAMNAECGCGCDCCGDDCGSGSESDHAGCNDCCCGSH